jgi:predicted transcriptional regulator
MTAPKEIAKKVIDSLPEDSTYQEIIRELAFDKMVQRGIEDAKNGRTHTDAHVKQKIAKW